MQKLIVGTQVMVRRARWRVLDLQPYEQCEVVTLARVDARHGGAAQRFIRPFDDINPVPRGAPIRRASLRRWRRACRAAIAAIAPAGSLRLPPDLPLDLMPHQLAPALAIVRGMATRVLLADEVGLGKTIQAGLIVSELRARGAADRVLILTPAGLRDQWVQELAAKLRIEASIVDAGVVRRRAAELPLGVNPWATFETAIASIDYVKRPEVLGAAAASHWDLIVVDEAHGAASENDRRDAVAALAARAGYVVLVTATPHNGDSESFASLCGMGRMAGDRLLIFRRARHDIRPSARRHVRHLLVRPTRAEARMHELLDRFVQRVRRERGDAACLAAGVLYKRAFSSAHSLDRSVRRRLDALDGIRDEGEQLALPLADPAGDWSDADLVPDWHESLALRSAGQERRLLRPLAAAAFDASRRESKIAALIRLLRRVREPAIVFSEYRDTALHVQSMLGDQSAVLHGGLCRTDRRLVLERFARAQPPILIATDAAGEGLNLQDRCRLVVNLELPWNPMRLEQRIGRVDRIGQRRTVHAVHVIGRDTAEQRVLARLRSRIARARAEAGAPDPVGGDEERAVARLVCGAPDVHQAPPAPALSTPVTSTLDLDSLLEARRLETCRTAGCDREAFAVDALGPAAWIARTRCRTTRIRLGANVLLLFRVAVEDDDGRRPEQTVVPLLVRVADPSSRGAIARLATSRELEPHIASASLDWRTAALGFAAAFADARLARERAIQASVEQRASAMMQAGLFDRRIDRARQRDEAERRSEAVSAASRLVQLERAAALHAGEPVLLLALTP